MDVAWGDGLDDLSDALTVSFQRAGPALLMSLLVTYFFRFVTVFWGDPVITLVPVTAGGAQSRQRTAPVSPQSAARVRDKPGA